MVNGIIQNLLNLKSKASITEPHHGLHLFYGLIFLILFSKRMFGVEDERFNIILTLFILFMMSFVLMATVIIVLEKENTSENVKRFSSVFNSPESRNFFAIIVLIFYIIFIYEIEENNNNQSHDLIDTITKGKNKYISNKTVSILTIFIIGFLYAFTIYRTTRDN